MNNEEKILELLEQLGKRQEEQGALLEQLGKKQEEQGAILAEHSAALKDLKRDMTELNNRSLRSALDLEGTVIPRLQLLFEGQENLRQTLTPSKETERLAEEVSTMKIMLKSMAERVTALEKAQ